MALICINFVPNFKSLQLILHIIMVTMLYISEKDKDRFRTFPPLLRSYCILKL